MAKSASKGARSRKKKTPEPTGLLPEETLENVPRDVEGLCRSIGEDGGKVLAPYREPLGGHWVVLSVLPLDQVEPTPYQRGISEAHVKRLSEVISKTNRYLDPVIAFRVGEMRYQTPNGHHRATALKKLNVRSITALVVTEPEVARLILALNVEKAHNLREKCIEVIRLARELSKLESEKEAAYALEFDEPAFLTLGLCYEARPRFAGGAYHPLLKRVDGFLSVQLSKALAKREDHVKTLLAIDDRVAEIVSALKERGFESPYLKSFVVARINPLRFRRGASMPLEEALEKMLQAATKFNVEKVSVSDLARSGGVAEGD
jgi:ParB family chromosome partitioning protein